MAYVVIEKYDIVVLAVCSSRILAEKRIEEKINAEPAYIKEDFLLVEIEVDA